MFWNPDLDPHSLTEDFYNKAFKNAAMPMSDIYERWSNFISYYNIPKDAGYHPESATGYNQQSLYVAWRSNLRYALDNMNSAYNAETDLGVRKRLDHMAMYLHWLRLRLDYDRSVANNASDIVDRAHGAITYTQRLLDTGLIHSFALLYPEYEFEQDAPRGFLRAKQLLGSDWSSSVGAWRQEGVSAGVPSSSEAYQTFLEDYGNYSP